MKRLRSGEISQVEMNAFHTLLYKTNRVVDATEWKNILATAYVRHTVTLYSYWSYRAHTNIHSIQLHWQLRMDRLVFNASTECMHARHSRQGKRENGYRSWKRREIHSRIRGEVRLFSGRSSGMSSCRSSRSGDKTSYQDLLPYIVFDLRITLSESLESILQPCSYPLISSQKPHPNKLNSFAECRYISRTWMVCSWTLCVVSFKRQDFPDTSHNIKGGKSRVGLDTGYSESCSGNLRLYLLSTQSYFWW